MSDAIVLIDAHNWMHRFHHAMPPQMHQGRNVAAVRGIRDLARRFAQQLRPRSVVAVFDAGDSGRTALFPGYKAGRSETPEDLKYQIDVARDFLPRFEVATVRVDGFEADDVIATIAVRSRSAGCATHIVSNDKDLCALVADAAPSVSIHAKRDEQWQMLQEAAVKERFGVGPQTLLDLLALAGDASDGIPGIPGIGPKIAADLLIAHGALELLLRAALLLPTERLRRLLQEHSEAVRLYRRLLDFVTVPWDDIKASTWQAERKRQRTP